jgi:hypothetical protein
MSEDHICFRSSSTPSGTVRGFSTEFYEGFVPHIRRRSLIRNRLRARGSMWRNSSIPTTGWWTTSITWPTTVHQVHRHRCNHGLERTLPQSVADTPWGLHVTTDDVAPSFVMLCAPHAAKIPNYSTTSERIADAPRYIFCGLRTDRVHIE